LHRMQVGRGASGRERDTTMTARPLPAVPSPSVASGCAVFAPPPEPTRFCGRPDMIPTSGAPLKGAVTIRWDRHRIPFIDAEHDAALALGIVQAHLRLGVSRGARHAAQGRLSQMIGFPGVDVDRTGRTIDFDRAVPEMMATMPDETRAWLEGHVAGLTFYPENAAVLPHEDTVLDLDPEPFTVEDVLTAGRLVGSDQLRTVWLTRMRARPARLARDLRRPGQDRLPGGDALGRHGLRRGKRHPGRLPHGGSIRRSLRPHNVEDRSIRTMTIVRQTRPETGRLRQEEPPHERRKGGARTMKFRTILAAAIGSAGLVAASPSGAAEGASSHYLPGTAGDIALAVPPAPGLQFANITLVQAGSVDAAVLQGEVDLGLDVTVALDLVAGF